VSNSTAGQKSGSGLIIFTAKGFLVAVFFFGGSGQIRQLGVNSGRIGNICINNQDA